MFDIPPCSWGAFLGGFCFLVTLVVCCGWDSTVLFLGLLVLYVRLD